MPNMQVELVIDQLAASMGSCEAALDALEALARVCWADEDAREVAASEAGECAVAPAPPLRRSDAAPTLLEQRVMMVATICAARLLHWRQAVLRAPRHGLDAFRCNLQLLGYCAGATGAQVLQQC